VSSFEGCWHRIDRATAHRKATIEEWNTFLDEDPYSTVLRHEGEGHYELTVVQDAPSRPLIPVLFGEWLQDLRIALNYCVYDVAIFDSGEDPPPEPDKLEFPIYERESSFTSNLQKIRPLTERHRGWIEAVQPYKDTAHDPQRTALYWLNELARIDRHRSLHIIGAYIVESDSIVRAPGKNVVFEDIGERRIMLNGEAVIARFQVTPWAEGDKVEANPQVALDPEITEWAMRKPDPTVWETFSFGERLRLIETLVQTIVGRFERDCTGWTRIKHLLRDEPDPKPGGVKEPSRDRGLPAPSRAW